jgi:hypothetical protein
LFPIAPYFVSYLLSKILLFCLVRDDAIVHTPYCLWDIVWFVLSWVHPHLFFSLSLFFLEGAILISPSSNKIWTGLMVRAQTMVHRSQISIIDFGTGIRGVIFSPCILNHKSLTLWQVILTTNKVRNKFIHGYANKLKAMKKWRLDLENVKNK